MYFFNFSDQDYDAMRSVRYQYPEYLSSTDNPVVALRKLVTEHVNDGPSLVLMARAVNCLVDPEEFCPVWELSGK